MKARKIISIVGAGGKTSLLYAFAHHLQKEGKKVLITTTTKIYLPKTNAHSCLITPASFSNNQTPWSQHSIVVIGDIVKADKIQKLKSPPDFLLQTLAEEADYILCEADGSKHLPVKFPAPWEPVLLPYTDQGIIVLGLSALNRPLREVCHRSFLAADYLGADEHHLVTKEDILALALVYYDILQANGRLTVSFLFNQYQNILHTEISQYLKENLLKKGAADVTFAHLAAPTIL